MTVHILANDWTFLLLIAADLLLAAAAFRSKERWLLVVAAGLFMVVFGVGCRIAVYFAVQRLVLAPDLAYRAVDAISDWLPTCGAAVMGIGAAIRYATSRRPNQSLEPTPPTGR